MKNWRSTISGTCAAVGVTLFGMPLVCSQFSGPISNVIPQDWYKWMILSGILFNVLGVFFGHLFAADAKAVNNLKEQVQENSDALRTGDTSYVRCADGQRPGPDVAINPKP
jgi:hypothetical protein